MTSFESVLCMKTVKTRLFKKNIWKEKNCGHSFVCLLFDCISVKKIIENCNFVGAGAHKAGKVVSFWPKVDPNFLDIWRA